MATSYTPSNTTSASTNTQNTTNASGNNASSGNAVQNPLLDLRKYQVRYILVAFSTTSDAVNTKVDYTVGNTGTVLTGTQSGQKAVVVVNEFTDSRFMIYNHTNEFNFHSFFDRSTTSMTGSITISDMIGSYFSDFMKNIVAKTLDLSQTHIIFSLRTFITGTNSKQKEVIIPVNPLIFHMINLSNGFNDTDKANFYTLSYLSDYNTYGLLPNYSKMFQMTITHKNSQSVIQKVSSSASRKDLDTARQTKNNNDVTMKTLKDVFEGFEKALKNKSNIPQTKLNTWMGLINKSYPQYYGAPQQKSNKGTLPIDYNIILDEYYNDYEIDNRNMAFEQPEQSQLLTGIKSYQVKPAKFITKVVNNLMKLSTKVGIDASTKVDRQRSYKSNISTIKTNDNKYQFDMIIKSYVVPNNSETVDTGPGESGKNPLTFTYMLNNKTADILGVHMSMNSDSYLEPNQDIPNNTDNKVVLGNREPLLNERTPSTDFFKTAFSGNRAMANNKNYSLENPVATTAIDNIVKTNLTQTSTIFIDIIGNPYLLSDIFRDPTKVASGDDDNPYYYKFPEYYPMYAYLDIYIKPSSFFGDATLKNLPLQYYYKGYYHLGKITTEINGSQFRHRLELYRTDDTT